MKRAGEKQQDGAEERRPDRGEAVMKDYVFVVRITSEAEWVVEAETPEEAERRFEAAREDGEPPAEEEVVDSEIVAVYEDGFAIPPPGKKRYCVVVGPEGGLQRYEVFAADEDEAMDEGVGRFLDQHPGDEFLDVQAWEIPTSRQEP